MVCEGWRNEIRSTNHRQSGPAVPTEDVFAQMNDFSAILLDAKAYSLSGCQERLLTDLGARRAIPEALGRGEIPRGF
jgi:hypothetical protein